MPHGRTDVLIDEFLPVYDFTLHNHIEIDAPIEEVYAVVRNLDLRDATLFRFLVWLRGAPARLRGQRILRSTLEDLLKHGFTLLGEEPPHELVLGMVGKLWTVSGHLQKLGPEEFRGFATPGFAKVAWNFSLTPLEGGRSRLATESRAQCLDEASRQKVRRYLSFSLRFSSVIRWSALRACKRQAEDGTHAHHLVDDRRA